MSWWSWLFPPNPCPFKRGQRVICIDGSDPEDPKLREAMPLWPQAGEVYTVSQVLDGGGIRLRELKNPLITWDRDGVMVELAFRHERFQAYG